MRKFILSTIGLLLCSILLVSFFSDKLLAQEKKPLTCEEFIKLSKTAECKYYAIQADRGIWCGDEEADIYLGDEHAVYKDRAPDYSIAFDPLSCGKQETQTEQQLQPAEQKSDQIGQTANPAQALNDWIAGTFEALDFTKIETEIRDEKLYGRTPQMTEEIIRKAQEEWKTMTEGSAESPYRLDIQKGDIAIKLPGQTEWSTLKQGDRIPPGSTIFTGMDSTTVLSIRDKGVIQVQSFTEITITEKGLEEAAKTGQTYTDIELRTGEIELNLPSGIFTGSLRVTTPTAHNAIRGTHFWVSYDKDKKLSTTGVYKGQVEVKALGSDKTILVSPNGNKPGVVVITQKLSAWKLLFAGVMVMGIIGGVVLLLKKRN